MGHGVNTTNFRICWKLAQTMRAQPTFTYATPLQWSFGNSVTALSPAEYTADAISVDCTTTGVAANGAYMLTAVTNTNTYRDWETHVLQWHIQGEATSREQADLIKYVVVRIGVCNSTP